MTTGLTLGQQVREDWVTHSRRTLLPGLHAVVVHRVGVWARQQPLPVRLPLMIVYRVLNNLLVRNVYGVELHDTTRLGRRVRIAHHMGVVIGGGAVIGDDVLIRQNVTVGRSSDAGSELPRIGNGVQIGAGASILGGVTVGDGARIGPGAVVMSDVPAGGSAFAPLARVLRPAPTEDPGAA